MKQNDWKDRLGTVYSTNPDFAYETVSDAVTETLEPARQRLRVNIEKSGRGGKTVTVVKGFVGAEEDLKTLGRTLKARLGVGGSVKDGLVIVQGQWRERIVEILRSLGYGDTK